LVETAQNSLYPMAYLILDILPSKTVIKNTNQHFCRRAEIYAASHQKDILGFYRVKLKLEAKIGKK